MPSLFENVAGQFFYFQGVTAADGTAFTGAVTGQVSKGSGAAAAITGTVTHLANGMFRVAPSQADTNSAALGFTFSGSGMIPVTASFLTVKQGPSGLAEFEAGQISDGAIGASTIQANALNGKGDWRVNNTYPANFGDLGITAVIGAIVRTDQVGEVAAGAIQGTSFGTDAITATAFSQGAADKAWSTSSRTITGGTVTNVTNGVDLVADAIKASTIQADAGNKIADFVGRRASANIRAASHTGIDALNSRSLLGMVGRGTNRANPNQATGKIEFYEENDTTVWWTQTYSTDPLAELITEVNTD